MKFLALLSTLILIGLSTQPVHGQDLDSATLQNLKRGVVTIKAFSSDGKLIREGRGFFANAEGDVITNRQVLRDADRLEIRTFDDSVYRAQTVTGVDEPTGLLRLKASDLQLNGAFPKISTDTLKHKQSVFILNETGAVKLVAGTDLTEMEIPTLGRYYKVTQPMPLASSGNPAVNASGELIGILLVETLAGGIQSLIVPGERISGLKRPLAAKASVAYWTKRNNLEWLFTGAGRYYKGIVLQVAEGCAQSLPVFESALEEDRNNANAWLLAGRCKFERGDAQEALEYYRRALRLKPDLAEAHFELGNAYIEAFEILGEEAYETARESYRKAIALKPDYLKAYLALRAVNRKSGFILDTLDILDMVASNHPVGSLKGSGFGLEAYTSDYGQLTERQVSFKSSSLGYGTPTSSGSTGFWIGAYNIRGVFPLPENDIPEHIPSFSATTQRLTAWGNPVLYKPAPVAVVPYSFSSQLNPVVETDKQPPFNPFLKTTTSGASYHFRRPEYLRFGEYEKTRALQVPFVFSGAQTEKRFLANRPPDVEVSALTSTFSLNSTPAVDPNRFGNVEQRFNPYDPTSRRWSGAVTFDFPNPTGTSAINSSAPIGFNGARLSEDLEVDSARIAMLRSLLDVSSSSPSYAFSPSYSFAEQERPETLYSATWFTPDTPSTTATDIAAAVDYLEVGTRYLLKVALQDTPFATAKATTTTGQVRAAASELIPGMDMEVSYFSPGLEPQRGSSHIVTPQKGETAMVAFPISATTSDVRGIDVWVEIRLKGLVVYKGSIKISVVTPNGRVVAETEEPRKTEPLRLVARPAFKPGAARKYEALKDNDVEITITPQPERAFNILIDWKGHRRTSRASNLDTARLNDLLEGVRGDLETLLSAASALGGIQKEGSDEREIDSLAVDPNIRQQLIFQLAKLGQRLYEPLFEDQELRTLLAEIKAHAQKKPKTVLRVQIKHAIRGDLVRRLLLPFGLLYDGPKLNEDGLYEAKAENFWDSRYQIELDDTNSAYQKTTLCDGGPIRVIAVMDTGGTEKGDSAAEEWRKEIQQQLEFLKELKDTKRISLKLAKNEEEFVNIFRGNPSPSDFIYYYGHTAVKPKASFSITNNSRDLTDIKNAATENNGVRMLKEYPFVFLNSCKGVAFRADSEDTFLNLMNKLGASGFIGTESTMRIPYAARIGQEFFKKIVDYKSSVPVVQVLSELKREALKSPMGNPLIMLYSLYGDPSVRTCSYEYNLIFGGSK